MDEEQIRIPPPPWSYRVDCMIEPTGEVRVTRSDPRFAGHLGFSVEELERDGGWMSRAPSEDLDRSLQALEVLKQGQVWEGRVRTLTAGGDLVTLRVRSSPTLLGDGRVSITVDLRDETEVAKLEALLAERTRRLELLEQAVTVASWTTNNALRLVKSSAPDAVVEAAGLETDEWVGRTIYEIFGTDDPNSPPIAAHERALRGEAASYEVDWAERSWFAHVEAYRDELGRVAGVLGIAVDRAMLMDAVRSLQPSPLGGKVGELAGDAGSETIVLKDLVIDPERFKVLKSGEPIMLTVTEFKLLMEFARRPGRVLSREVLAERVWGQEFFGHTSSVTMAVSRLRDKIEDDPSKPSLIETVRGVGYRLADEGTSV